MCDSFIGNFVTTVNLRNLCLMKLILQSKYDLKVATNEVRNMDLHRVFSNIFSLLSKLINHILLRMYTHLNMNLKCTHKPNVFISEEIKLKKRRSIMQLII